MDDTPIRRRQTTYDWWLVFAVAGLCCLGLLSVYSATRFDARTGLDDTSYIHKQLLWCGIAVPLALAASRIDYHLVLQRRFLIYSLNIALLLIVLVGGRQEVKGAQRWIGMGAYRLQPSEFAKLAIIITLAAFLALQHEHINRPRTVILAFVHVAVPALIIFRQPDLGTALVVLSIWVAMSYVAGVPARHLVAILLVGLVAFGALWMTGGIKHYQKERLRVFVNIGADPQGVGYHISQALNAVGSGRLWGKGLFHGSQGQLGYVPEQHTDFIFTIMGEELGFIGAALVVMLYTLLLLRACTIAARAPDIEGRLLAVGITAMFLYHVVVNIGMNVGMAPVTGVPLPFMSYGGSSMIVNLLAVGMLQSVRSQQARVFL